MATGTHTGAPWRAGLPPGVYERTASPTRTIDVKMDVAAFVGLTERGPVATAVAVGSWTEFVLEFGRCGGGRQLPDAVWQFFANGGRRAVVSRAIRYAEARTARFRFERVGGLTAPLQVYAANPGAWGNSLRLSWWWRQTPLRAAPVVLNPDPDGRSTTWTMPAALAPAVGACLRMTRRYRKVGGERVDEVIATVEALLPLASGQVRLTLSAPMPPPKPAAGEVATDGPISELRGRLIATWADVVEDHDELALDPRHPDALDARLAGSRLVRAVAPAEHLRPGTFAGGTFTPAVSPAFAAAGVWTTAVAAVSDEHPGGDAAATTTRDVFFVAPGVGPAGSEASAWADRPSPLDALDAYDDVNEPEPVSLVCLPDLYHPYTSLPAIVDTVEGTTRFGACDVEPDKTPAAEHDWPLLTDPAVGADQARLVEWSEARRLVAILDLPPGLDASGVVTWKIAHSSPRAAAYAPYLRLPPPEDPLQPLRTVPPCGAVCGIIARQERRAGVHVAPANLALAGIPSLAADPLLPEPGFLHDERVNVIRSTEAGLRVMGSRTTSIDEEWTHLPVRRLVDWLERQVRLDCRWAPFEPNNTQLWRRLVMTVERRLRQAGAAGAWAGAAAEDSWFVRCDAGTHTQADLDNGRTIVLVGVAPAVPAEFLVFQIVLQRDGEVVTEVGGG